MNCKRLRFIMELIFIFILPLLFILPCLKIKSNFVYDNSGNYQVSEKLVEYVPITYYQQYENIIENFNLWDEEWENGYYSNNGEKNNGNLGLIRSKNAIPVSPNTTYYFNAPNYQWIGFYDISNVFISYISHSTNTTFVTPNDCFFIRFYEGSGYGDTYNNNICVNLSVSWANGNYVPYGEDLVIISDSNLSGNASIIKSPLSNIKDVVVDVLKLDYDNVVVNIVFDYTCLWFIMFILWHLFYLFIDFLLHFWKKEDN